MFYSNQPLLKSDGTNNFRIPAMIVTKSGAILAFANNRRHTLEDHARETTLVLLRKEPGKPWEPMRTIAAAEGCCYMIGTAFYDETTDAAICFFTIKLDPVDEFSKLSAEERQALQEASLRAAQARGVELGRHIAISYDAGLTWTFKKVDIQPNALGFAGSIHASDVGITLRHGPHAGRLICAGRYATAYYSNVEQLRKSCYNAAVYSDDHGVTWRTSLPVQQGTGEGSLAELDDGTIYFNSRAYYDDNCRYIAYSHDSGESFGDFFADAQLVEPVYGCNASLKRVDADGQTLLLFSNPRHPTNRVNMTVSVSRDGGKTWPVKKCITENPSAYSSLAYSEAERRVYLLYETGEKDCYEGMNVAEFDLEWLLTP